MPGDGLPAAAGRARPALGCHLLPTSPAEKVSWPGRRWAGHHGGRWARGLREHTRLTLTFTGTDGGTNPTDFWIIPSSGLIVREHETVGVTQGGVRYTESMDAMLTGLDPAR